MAGYEDTKKMIIDTLMGRDPGTEIMPENHQAFALNMLDYIRSVEMSSASTLIGIAEGDTTPIQPDNARVAYIAGVAQERTVTFVNFHDINGQPISITTGEMEAVFVILLWNTAYWTYQITNANIISAAENANFQYFLNMRKTYASVAAMNADADSHIADDGTPIRVGETVAVHNTSNPSENAIYSLRVTSNGVYYWQEQATLPALDISGMFNQVNANVNYIECSQNAEDEIKIISDTYFSLSTHMRLLVKMTNTNTHPTPKLNINGTGAKSIWYNGAVATDVNTWDAGEILDIYYDGTNYQSISIKDKTLYSLIESVNVGSQSSLTNAFNSVPFTLRRLGLKVTWYNTVNTKWITNQYIGNDLSGWNTESNWISTEFTIVKDSSIGDFTICDENGNILVVFSNGHIRTKNFDSSSYKEILVSDCENFDLTFTDKNGFDLVRFSNGHIRTKNFDSKVLEIPISVITRYKNKRISILGDSISTFGSPDSRNENGTYCYSYYPTETCRYSESGNVTIEGITYQSIRFDVNDTYWMKLINGTGMVLGINESWRGTRVSGSGNSAFNNQNRINHLGSNGTPDVILIYGGTNDAGGAVTLGTFNTENPANYTDEQIAALPTTTFADAYRTMLIRVMKTYPMAEIVVILPTFTTAYYTITNLDLYVEVIKEACDFFGIKYIDARCTGINIYNKAQYLVDGIHPNVAGMDLLYKKIYKQLIFN